MKLRRRARVHHLIKMNEWELRTGALLTVVWKGSKRITLTVDFRSIYLYAVWKMAQYRAHVLYRIHIVDSIDTVYLKEEKKPCGVWK